MTGSTRQEINIITSRHPEMGKNHLYCLPSPGPVGPSGEETDVDTVEPQLLFTENNTNYSRLYGGQNETLYVKDAFHDHIIGSHRPKESDSEESVDSFFHTRIRSRTASAFGGSEPPDSPEQGPCTPFPLGSSYVNPEKVGTKSAAHYTFADVPGQGGCAVVRLKMTPNSIKKDVSIEDEGVFDDAIEERRQEADEFYNALVFGPLSDDLKQIMRQALGGMLWSKQFYQFIQKDWIKGDPAQPAPPPEREYVRNRVSRSPHPLFCMPLNSVVGMATSPHCRYSFNAR